MRKPAATEYDPYFQRYIDLVPEGDIRVLLRDNGIKAAHFFSEIPATKQAFSYAPGKWTPKDVLMHIIDTERVMAYRALVAARADNTTILHPMDENKYAAAANGNSRSMQNLIAEFEAVRNSTLFIYEHLSSSQASFMARGEAHPFTAGALGYIMVGHVFHHLNILTERYL